MVSRVIVSKNMVVKSTSKRLCLLGFEIFLIMGISGCVLFFWFSSAEYWLEKCNPAQVYLYGEVVDVFLQWIKGVI
jgi:hypothetical protein